MFSQFKKFIAFILCAGLCAGILPSVNLMAIRTSGVKKEQTKSQPDQNTPENIEEENPTIQETWQKIKNREWKSLNRADAWNIGKVVVGGIGAFAAAYVLYTYKSTAPGTMNNPTPPTPPHDQAPSSLKDIMNNAQYAEYTEKLADLCNTHYMNQLEEKGLVNLQKQLEKEIQATSNPSVENIKKFIDRRHKNLQKHLEKRNITSKSSSETDTALKDKTKEKHKILYPRAEKSIRQNVQVVKQRGASCGYHALLNSVFSIQDIDENQANDTINTKFAQKDGPWRAIIIQDRKKALVNRKKELVRNYLRKILHSCMFLENEEEKNKWNTAKAEWDAKINSNFGWFYAFFSSAPKKPLKKLSEYETKTINLIANAYASAFVADETLNILQENPDNLEVQLQQLILLNHPHVTEKETENVSACIQNIDLPELTTEIAHATQLIETAKSYVFGSNLETDLLGNNLDTAEMETLKTIIIQEYDIQDDTITIIDRTGLLKYDPIYQSMLIPAKEKMLRNNCCVLSFCIRISNNEIEVEQLSKIIQDDNSIQEIKDEAASKLNELNSETNSTHWICVTLHRKNGQNIYSIKDSMKYDFTNHINVKQLIEALEQPYVPQRTSAITNTNEKNKNNIFTEEMINALDDIIPTLTSTTSTSVEKKITPVKPQKNNV